MSPPPAEYIIPDVFVRKVDDRWQVEISPTGVPRLSVNQTYARLLRGSGEHAVLKAQLQEVKDLFRNEDTTEFVIVTIPTVLGISESGRLLAELRKEGVPARRLVVNQIINVTGEGFKERKETLAVKEAALREALAAIEGSGVGGGGGGGDAATALDEMLAANASVVRDAQAAVTFCTVKAKDQRRAMEMLDADAGLRTLKRIEAPLFDMEIRGVPALQFMGGQVWTD